MRDLPPDMVSDAPVLVERGRAGAITLCGPDVRLVLTRRAAGLLHDRLGTALDRAEPAGRDGLIGPVAVRIMVAAVLVPMVWIALAGVGLALAVAVMPVRTARDWLPALALAVLAVAAWLAWILAPRLLVMRRWGREHSGMPPPRARPHLRVVK